MRQGRILVVDTDSVVIGPIEAALHDEGYVIQVAPSASRALAEVGQGKHDVAVVSLTLADADPLELMAALKARQPGLPILVTVPADRRSQGFAACAAGAYAFLEVPHDLSREKLLTVVANVVEHRRLAAELAAARAAGPGTLNLEELERQAIWSALEATKWNKQAAARLLGLHRPTLYSKMRKHGIPQRRPP